MRLFTKVAESNALATKLVGPIIEERLSYLNEYGNLWADKPVSRPRLAAGIILTIVCAQNDFLSWLMDQAEGAERTVEALTARLLFVNLLSIHVSRIHPSSLYSALTSVDVGDRHLPSYVHCTLSS